MDRQFCFVNKTIMAVGAIDVRRQVVDSRRSFPFLEGTEYYLLKTLSI